MRPSRFHVVAAVLVALATSASACSVIVGVGDITFVGNGGTDGGADSGTPSDARTTKHDADAAADARHDARDANHTSDASVDGDARRTTDAHLDAFDGGNAAEAGQIVWTAEAGYLPNGIAVGGAYTFWTVGPAEVSSGLTGAVWGSGPVVPPTAIVSGQSNPYGVTTDGTNVYWTNFCCAGCSDGGTPGATCDVLQVDQGLLLGVSSAPVTLATKQSFPAGISVNDTTVYWASYGGSNTGGVTATAIGGSGNTTPSVVGGEITDVAACGASLYWANLSAAAVGQIPSPSVAFSSSDPFAIACDATDFFWLNAGSASSGVYAVTGTSLAVLPGGGWSPGANGGYPVGAIATDDTNVYWVDTLGGNVMRASKALGAPTVLASHQAMPWSIALYTLSGATTIVYWVNHGDRTVRSLFL